MKSTVPFLLVAALALTAPVFAVARPGDREGDRGRDRGGQVWRGQDRQDRQERSGGGERGYGRDRDREGPAGDGRYDRRGPQGDGAYYAEPPRRPQNSLREGWREQQDEAREGVRNGELRQLGGIISDLRRRQPGRMLDTGIERGPNGQAVYRIRWAAQNGRRIDYIVDARTGAVIGAEGQ